MSSKISVFYTKSAQKDLRKLDKSIAKKIVLAIKKYTNEKPLDNAKALTGIFEGLYRYRVGDYRAVFQYDKGGVLTVLTILTIKHRRDVYKR